MEELRAKLQFYQEQDLTKDQEQRNRETDLVNKVKDLQDTLSLVQSNLDEKIEQCQKSEQKLAQKDQQVEQLAKSEQQLLKQVKKSEAKMQKMEKKYG